MFPHTKEFNQSPILGNIILFGIGCNFGWFSPSLPTLQSTDHTPLDGGPLTNDQVGWLGSAPSLGAIVGAIFYGIVANKCGYRNAIMHTFIPITVSRFSEILCG